MPDKVLFVDDDPSILDAYQRTLYKHLPVDTASGGVAALEKIQKSGPYSVVVTDIQMPGMDGIEFLTHAAEIAPDTVRMVLTGNAGLKNVMDALEHGGVFRYLTKPVPPENMLASLEAGIKQYQLQAAERELLEKTLQGSIRVMLEILSTVNPEVFGRAQALKGGMRQLAIALKQDQLWRFELGAMLAHLGMVTIPPSTLYKVRKGQPLGPVEEALLRRSPEISHSLIANIPRLEPVAKIVLYQKKNFDGTGFPENKVAGEDIPLGARMLRVLTDLAELESGSLSQAGAYMMLRKRTGVVRPQDRRSGRRMLRPRQRRGARRRRSGRSSRAQGPAHGAASDGRHRLHRRRHAGGRGNASHRDGPGEDPQRRRPDGRPGANQHRARSALTRGAPKRFETRRRSSRSGGFLNSRPREGDLANRVQHPFIAVILQGRFQIRDGIIGITQFLVQMVFKLL